MSASTARRRANNTMDEQYNTPFPKSVTIAPLGEESETSQQEWFPVKVVYSRASGWEFSLAQTPDGEPQRACHAPSFRAGGAEANGERLRYHW
mgnify:CR=1 FL=1